MLCSRTVFRCFKTLERLADRFTGAAGPVFVTLAIILLATGVVCFFDVIQPSLRWQLITFPLDALIVVNLLGQYYLACTVPPGFVDDAPQTEESGWIWAKRRKDEHRLIAEAGMGWQMTRAEVTKCKKCLKVRPERAHHCSVCNRCVLKYDHHCPVRINQCVGIYNERHFVLFMAYLILATFWFTLLGYDKMWEALGLTMVFWPHHVPAVAFALIYILAFVLCLAVGVMCTWHLWSIMKGETAVETYDHDVYRRVAKERGEVFVNSFDLGRLKNLQMFFNVTETGYPYYTLLFPFRVPPYTDGRSWARREGYDRHKGIRPGEELTDEEEEEEEE